MPNPINPQALVVEDELALRMIYDRVLQKLGYEVLQARDGEQALDLLQENSPSLIFLDMLLPRVNGQKVLEYIASQPRLAATHVVIASSSSYMAEHVQIVPSAQFILKPVLPDQIRQIASSMLQRDT